MPYVTNPDAEPRNVAQTRAELMADSLREDYPGYKVEIRETFHSRLQVIVEVPFRVETPTWDERESARVMG